MAATVQELIKKGFSMHSKSLSTGFKLKIDLFSNHFGSVKSFLDAEKETFERLVFVIDDASVKLTANDFKKIQDFQQSGILDANLTVHQNFIKILTTEFVSRQVQMIEGMKLETLNVNPILAGALNLDNETDLIRYYVYQAISRSVVTSVGFLVQNLIAYSSEYVQENTDQKPIKQTKWHVVVEKIEEIKTFLNKQSEIPDKTDYISEKLVLQYLLEKEYIFNQIWLYDLLYFNEMVLKSYTDLVNSCLASLKDPIELKISQL